MKLYLDDANYSKLWKRLLFLFVLFFLVLRFIHLDADFPAGITGSGVLYTDEGWYANAAIRHYITGEWYLEGDFNPAINMPAGQFLQRVSFELLGSSLISVRIMVTIAFILLVIAATLFVYRRYGYTSALISASLMVSSHYAFAFSRLGTMEFIATFFAFSGLLLAWCAFNPLRPVRLLLAAILVSAGILTKTTMIFTLPLFIYIAWLNEPNLKARYTGSAILLLVSIGIVGSYFLYIKTLYPGDYTYFKTLNFDMRSHENFLHWLAYLPLVILKVGVLGILFFFLTIYVVVRARKISAEFRHDPFMKLLFAYVVLYLGMLSIVSYGPARYYIPLFVPLVIICTRACVVLWKDESLFHGKFKLSKNTTPAVIVLLIVMIGTFRNSIYIMTPEYSFVQMSQQVAELIHAREKDLSDVYLLGNFLGIILGIFIDRVANQ